MFHMPTIGTQGGSGELRTKSLRLIKLLLVVYVYDAAHDTFRQVPSMPVHMPLQIHNAMKALQLINEGKLVAWVAAPRSLCRYIML